MWGRAVPLDIVLGPRPPNGSLMPVTILRLRCAWSPATNVEARVEQQRKEKKDQGRGVEKTKTRLPKKAKNSDHNSWRTACEKLLLFLVNKQDLPRILNLAGVATTKCRAHSATLLNIFPLLYSMRLCVHHTTTQNANKLMEHVLKQIFFPRLCGSAGASSLIDRRHQRRH